VPAGKVIHAILDNYAAHKHPNVLAWLADHPRWTFHFTPTSCSCSPLAAPACSAGRGPWRASLNAVEGFFSKLAPAEPQTRRLPFRRRPRNGDHPIHRRHEQNPQTIRLDRNRQGDCDQTRIEPSV
jgi:hypothetical protein